MQLEDCFNKVEICIVHGDVMIGVVVGAGAMGHDGRAVIAPVSVLCLPDLGGRESIKKNWQ